MHKRIEKIKDHFSVNKDRYITGAGCLVVGAAVGIFVCGTTKIVDSQNLNAIINWKSPMTRHPAPVM